jgi:hypothetical protein
MIGAMARHRIQVLRASGMTLRRIASETGIPLRSVKRIANEPAIEEPRDAASAKERGVGRPSVVEPFHEKLVAVLKAEPKLPTVEILHRMRGLGYRGAKTALYEAVRRLRPRPAVPLVRFDRRNQRAHPLLRLAPEVLALDSHAARGGRTRGIPGEKPTAWLREFRRRAVGGGVR